MRPRDVIRSPFLLLGALCALGCASSDAVGDADSPAETGSGGRADGATGGGATGGGATGGGDTGGVATGGAASGGAATGGGLDVGGQPPDDPDLVSEVFFHTRDSDAKLDVLYRLDPVSSETTEIGEFDFGDGQGVAELDDGVLDIAVDKDRNLIATTRRGVWSVDPETAEATLLAEYDEQLPFSLSFVPAGTFEDSPDGEVLVAYLDRDVGDAVLGFRSDYVRIDPATGDITTVTERALPDDVISSGDIVSVIDGGTYLTVKFDFELADGATPRCDESDCLVRIDPATGRVLEDFGEIGFNNAFGLAYWGGSAYGFTASTFSDPSPRAVFEMRFAEDLSLESIDEVTIAGIPSDVAFWGAGSTTSAPVYVLR